jgi:hypothetical protein
VIVSSPVLDYLFGVMKHQAKNSTDEGETTMQRMGLATTVLLMGLFLISSDAPAQIGKPQLGAKSSAAQAANVSGGGTSGQIAKWAGVSGSSSYVLNDSNIFEDKFGKVGIGTKTPTSLLTVQGMIETTLGGLKFPDGTVQTTAFNPNQVVRSLNGLQGDLVLAAGANITVTPSNGNTLTIAAPNALTTVTHNATLTGNGTAASPLGIADGGVDTAHLANNAVTAAKIAPGNVVKSLNGLKDEVTLAAGANITLTPVGNTLTIASTTINPGQNAYQGALTLEVPYESGDFVRSGNIPVPAGKRFVIEYLTLRVFEQGDAQPLEVKTTVNGVTVKHWIQLPVDDTGFYKAIDKQVRIYSDSDVHFVIVNRSGEKKFYDITVSGYLVDLP